MYNITNNNNITKNKTAGARGAGGVGAGVAEPRRGSRWECPPLPAPPL